MKPWQPLIIFLSFIIVLTFLIAVFLDVSFDETQEEITQPSPDTQVIASFEECVAAGNPILESYPEQCITEDGDLFVRQLSSEELRRNNPDYPSKEYYGGSTNSACSSSSDCVINGCNSETCGSTSDDPLASICVVPTEPTPLELGYSCECINSACQWNK